MRTAVVVRDGATTHIVSGLKDLTVLKTTQSGFVGYPRDKYTTLPETTDRILATDVSARWRYNTNLDASATDFNKSYEDIKALLLEGFTENYSHALQQTLFDMGKKVLEAHSEVAEIKFSMPNKHHFWTTPTRSSSPPTARTASSKQLSSATTPPPHPLPGWASLASAKHVPASYPRRNRA